MLAKLILYSLLTQFNLHPRNEGYTYPTFSTSFDSSVLKGFGIKCFPAVVVLNPDGNMIYFGDIEGAAKLVDFIFK